MAAAKLGDRNPVWRGDTVSYRAAHSRVERARGKAAGHLCKCGRPAYDWANLTGEFSNVNDYEPMCRTHHRAYDKGRAA